jgi:predicted 3-demethylubiquinone-9 3-methyltransferase (glyoxalase superfamily)
MSQKITPFLWFNARAEQAAKFYTSVFKQSKILWSSAMSARFRLEGQEFIAFNGGPEFKFSPAISFLIRCKTQDEIDYYWRRLSAGGKIQQCGWLIDKFGVSWQVVPSILGDLINDKNEAKAGRVMQAMLKMKKLDFAKLKKAYAGK